MNIIKGVTMCKIYNFVKIQFVLLGGLLYSDVYLDSVREGTLLAS